MAITIPDLNWYLAISKKNNGSPRCPFATVESCPRFYQSLSLLGSAGSTSIDRAEDKHLLEKWKTSDLWPKTREQETMISGNNKFFDRFCPEVAFERFGYFASYLGRYSHELDHDLAHKKLGEIGASSLKIVGGHGPQWFRCISLSVHCTQFFCIVPTVR